MVSNFAKAFESFQRNGSSVPPWVEDLRVPAKESFLEKGIPSFKDEDWKYTSTRSLKDTDFLWHRSEPSMFDASIWFLPNAINLVLIDGRMSKPFTMLGKSVLCPLTKACWDWSHKVKEAMTLNSTSCQNALTLLNEAFLEDGYFLWLADGEKVEQTIHLINVISAKDKPNAILPRNILYLGKNSQASVIETIVHVETGPSVQTFINSVTDIILSENSQLSYAKMQKQTNEDLYVGHTRVYQNRDSRFYSFFDVGGPKLSREAINVKLAGEAALARIRGIFHTQGKQHLDYNVFVEHAASYTVSRQLFKGVAEDESRVVFNGLIKVIANQHKIDARQVSKNIILGADAEIDARPQFEIESDDVKCAHGAAIGSLRSDEIFYLQSRGFTKAQAEKTLSTAFTDEVVFDIKDPAFLADVNFARRRV